MNLHSLYDSMMMDGHRHGRKLFLGLLLLLFAVPTVGQAIRLKDQTDWWSINGETFRREDVKPRAEKITAGTFEISGIALGNEQFRIAAAEFGKAPVVQRGDASTGRQQVCYVGGAGSRKVYLIFEFGEDESVFYLFGDGPVWRGRSFCVAARQLSTSIGTDSGLKLGLAPTQVEAILGVADVAHADKLVYVREVRQKTTSTQFEQLRREYPQPLSDSEAHEKFDFYSSQIYIEARFGKDGLNYLAVSTSGGPD